ncbi:DUF1697 domain-containing protein [Mycobacterium tilburgii]|uniref:DUF1697 domain-containing protein n=1 Tax=Mycobacterium tilburgii TaxID=44467 RepID=UPI003899331F
MVANVRQLRPPVTFDCCQHAERVSLDQCQQLVVEHLVSHAQRLRLSDVRLIQSDDYRLRGVPVRRQCCGVNLKMADVVTALTGAGFTAVRTILSSGNVLLESPADAGTVRKKAEAALREKLGYDAWVLVYDTDSVRSITDAYSFEPEVDGYSVLRHVRRRPRRARRTVRADRRRRRKGQCRRRRRVLAGSQRRHVGRARWASRGTGRRRPPATCGL